MNRPYKKIVVWGRRLINSNSHTHSYVHAAFVQAYRYLGEDVYWLADEDDTSLFDFSNTLFITEGFENLKMPIRNDSWYVLHHVDFNRFAGFENRIINLKAYSTHNLSFATDAVKINDFEYLQNDYVEADITSRLLVIPWATHLLPHEIELLPKEVIAARRKNLIHWVGSITDGEMGNIEQIRELATACNNLKINFHHSKVSEGWESRAAIQESVVAPCIVGGWQKSVDYLPCRAFKNASFCRVPMTNSRVISEMLNNIPPVIDGKVEDCIIQCFNLESTTDACKEVAKIVKEKHTYVNRIKTIEKAFGWS